LTVTVQVGDEPEHEPPQLRKTESLSGVAVRVIWVPLVMFDWLVRLHDVPHDIVPPVTVPLPSYDFSSDKVKLDPDERVVNILP
jgi:hypothetical protein